MVPMACNKIFRQNCEIQRWMDQMSRSFQNDYETFDGSNDPQVPNLKKEKEKSLDTQRRL